ncbi:hypothetical protein [Streptomyces sp. NPDC051452]
MEHGARRLLTADPHGHNAEAENLVLLRGNTSDVIEKVTIVRAKDRG